MAAKNYKCSVPSCHAPALARSLCNRHYLRWKKYGDPQGGGPDKTPDGAPVNFLRQCFRLEHDECIPWPFARKDGGQGCLWFDGKVRVASNLLCEWTHGPAPSDGHQAAHSCGNGHIGCVNKRHLIWKTPTENSADRVAHGTDNRGRKHPLSKLADTDVREIRAMRGEVSQRELARRFGISQGTVFDIQNRKTWRHI